MRDAQSVMSRLALHLRTLGSIADAQAGRRVNAATELTFSAMSFRSRSFDMAGEAATGAAPIRHSHGWPDPFPAPPSLGPSPNWRRKRPTSSPNPATARQRIRSRTPVPELRIHADRQTPYERVAQTMALASRLGLSRIGFVTTAE